MPASNYAPKPGKPFFLLTDRSYGSDENAQVRVEVPLDQSDQRVDVRVYRIPKPLEFLKSQRNLHRVSSRALYVGEGAGQTLNYLYDRWTKETRRSWQRALATPARARATALHPGVKMGGFPLAPTQFKQPALFKPLPGLELMKHFRYPVGAAKPIAPPKDLKLAGSSSEFIATYPGNVMVPLGKLTPGLYLVEAFAGGHRASTLVFVSDTVVVTKNAQEQMLAWAVHRNTGVPVSGANLLWTDGVGVLRSGTTQATGLVTLRKQTPEQSYVLGEDPQGGVFVSENFYYDSEIYNAKIYAVTDRPLYRPGDSVKIKFLGRSFQDSQHSRPLENGTLKLEVMDPNGSPLLAQQVVMDSRSGGETAFILPPNAPAGGWELRFAWGSDLYGAAFRVAQYVKPHFDIHLGFDKPNVKSGEPISGQIRLTYPDGKPVKDGKLSLSVRAQQTTMVDGELQYAGLFPVQLEQQELAADDQGIARFSLPPAAQPSRYVFTMSASDGAAYRVKVTRELLVERGQSPWTLAAAQRFSAPGEKVTFRFAGQRDLPEARWEVIRLESQTRTTGNLAAGTSSLNVEFDHPGSYTVSLRDAAGNLLGAVNHWVSGKGVKTTPGSIEIVADRARYAVGETAKFLITFPDATQDALLTLERDAVERAALLSQPNAWMSARKLADNQWQVSIPVTQHMAPNMSVSVARVKGGDFVFQNAGLVVDRPAVEVAVRADKPSYRPGETVRLDFTSTYRNKPVEALLTVSVVDEMVYVLQPELAPSILEFFHHMRRNNVRTTSSLAFIGYDQAINYMPEGLSPSSQPERNVKVLERPRRDDVDTAAWFPRLRTDKRGRASVTFSMPDSLTRWRVTARALTPDGEAGQRTAYVLSDKALYVKWVGSRQFRDEDEATADLVAFNRGRQPVNAQLRTLFGSKSSSRNVTLQPGPNFIPLLLKKAHRGALAVQLVVGESVVDHLAVDLRSQPVAWPARQQQIVTLSDVATPLSLPADASDVRLTLLQGGAEHFLRVAEDLLDYPYGCVEQTSSRLLPLALAKQSLGAAAGSERVTQLLQAQRSRLVQLAGNNGTFGWWGRDAASSAFLTGYAYYADYFAARSLGIQLPADHWSRVLESYRTQGEQEPLLHRALILWWANEMQLPVQTLAQGVLDELMKHPAGPDTRLGDTDSLSFVAPDSLTAQHAAALVLERIAASHPAKLSPAETARIRRARTALADHPSPFIQSLLYLGGSRPASRTPETILSQASQAAPTFERSMALVWLHKALGGFSHRDALAALRPTGWTARSSPLAQTQWQWMAPNPPGVLQLAKKPASPITAAVSYTATEAGQSRLPLELRRRLYKLVPLSETLRYKAVPVAAGETLSPSALYVDELALTPASGKRFTYGLLEVPLPPGGSVEGTTWGLHVAGLDKQSDPAAYASPLHEMGELSYRVPLEKIDKPMVTRQLLRFQQRGRFVLPPARYFRMYAPSDKSFAGGSLKPTTWIVE